MLYLLMVVSRLSSMFAEEPASLTDFGYVLSSMEGLAKMLAKMVQEGRLPCGLAKEKYSKTQRCMHLGRETWCLCVSVRLVIVESGTKLCWPVDLSCLAVVL